VTGTIGIILLNVKQKRFSKKEAKNIINELMNNSYRLSVEVYARALELIENS
jgi:predicted nucleic acid-binding protein